MGLVGLVEVGAVGVWERLEEVVEAVAGPGVCWVVPGVFLDRVVGVVAGREVVMVVEGGRSLSRCRLPRIRRLNQECLRGSYGR